MLLNCGMILGLPEKKPHMHRRTCKIHTERSQQKYLSWIFRGLLAVGSCFAFVNRQQSFPAAQDWCEKSGGHLAFIPDKNTQNFFEKHLDPDKDVWLGMAPSTSTRNPVSASGALSWLDGSPLTYSKWLRSPQPGAACGHILRSSSFQWEATSDCYQEMNFICQYGTSPVQNK
uniref:C-type lectin domain-containing protein n=1 Tax=Oryzias latipes TaxID=8090 RepID=A0A3P9KS94_ORYLA